ncbi:MAG: hypothetical protein JXR63_12270 [Spirochaetales bacterium]|nr:hypothetical protein [Spirochaetales bacterium]
MCPSKQILSAFFDNEVEQKFYVQIKAHVESCSECSDYLNSLKELSARIKQDSESVVTPELSELISRAKAVGQNHDELKRHMLFQFPSTIVKYSAVAAVVVGFSLALIIPFSYVDSSSSVVAESESEQIEELVVEDLENPAVSAEEEEESTLELLKPFSEYNKIRPVDNR